MKRSINEWLSGKTTQRFIYLLALLVLTLLSKERIFSEARYYESALGVNYQSLYVVPAFFLVLQIIMNNRVFWSIIVLFYAVFAVVFFYRLSGDLSRINDPIKPITLDPTGTILIILAVAVVAAMGWILIRIKPDKLI